MSFELCALGLGLNAVFLWAARCEGDYTCFYTFCMIELKNHNLSLKKCLFFRINGFLFRTRLSSCFGLAGLSHHPTGGAIAGFS
ncbi:hypothetical protein VN23_14270 [Janthinobacterium sp. B9-8]|nr:hypothetical protein VN23_14270 [Janthinobacterium sp. B9-8]